jgi:hypothetical protein
MSFNVCKFVSEKEKEKLKNGTLANVWFHLHCASHGAEERLDETDHLNESRSIVYIKTTYKNKTRHPDKLPFD